VRASRHQSPAKTSHPELAKSLQIAAALALLLVVEIFVRSPPLAPAMRLSKATRQA
jgi:hypothetical protein